MRGVLLGGLAGVLAAACGGADRPVAGPEPAETAPPRSARVADEDPDDGLEVQSTRGRMERADIEAGLAPHARALQDCYLARIGKQRWLGGTVELRWDVAGDGVLRGARVVRSDLGSWPVEQCMLEVARQITFAAPRGGDADFRVPFELSGGRGGVVWWDEEMAHNVVARRVGELAGCAGEAKAADPTDVTVTLYVGTRGKVQAAGFASPALIDDAWAACAHGKVTAWTLSDPRGKVAKLGFVYRPGETPGGEDDE
jgi:hypothetical protein